MNCRGGKRNSPMEWRTKKLESDVKSDVKDVLKQLFIFQIYWVN